MKLSIIMDDYSIVVNGLPKKSTIQCVSYFIHIPPHSFNTLLFVLVFYNIVLCNE
jgi:hypothetical protein